MQYHVRCFRLYVSATVQRCRCRIGAMSYALRIRIMHHSAASARRRAMDYALRIRIMHQAPKARRRGLCTTHYVSVLCRAASRRQPRESSTTSPKRSAARAPSTAPTTAQPPAAPGALPSTTRNSSRAPPSVATRKTSTTLLATCVSRTHSFMTGLNVPPPLRARAF